MCQEVKRIGEIVAKTITDAKTPFVSNRRKKTQGSNNQKEIDRDSSS